jgi:hypothetical protein
MSETLVQYRIGRDGDKFVAIVQKTKSSEVTGKHSGILTEQKSRRCNSLARDVSLPRRCEKKEAREKEKGKGDLGL